MAHLSLDGDTSSAAQICTKNARNVERCNNSVNSRVQTFFYTEILIKKFLFSKVATLNKTFSSYLPKPSQNNSPYRSVLPVRDIKKRILQFTNLKCCIKAKEPLENLFFEPVRDIKKRILQFMNLNSCKMSLK